MSPLDSFFESGQILALSLKYFNATKVQNGPDNYIQTPYTSHTTLRWKLKSA